MHLAQRFLVEAAADVSGVHEAVAIVIADEKRAEILPRFARLRVSAHDELLPALELELEPGVRPLAQRVGRIGALGHDAFPTSCARLAEHLARAARRRVS